MYSNYVAEIQSTSIPDEQLVLSVDMIHVSGRHVSYDVNVALDKYWPVTYLGFHKGGPNPPLTSLLLSLEPTFHPFPSLSGGPYPLIRLEGLGERPAVRRFLLHFRLKRTLLVTCATFAVLKRESSSLKKSRRSGQGGLAQGPPLNTPLGVNAA